MKKVLTLVLVLTFLLGINCIAISKPVKKVKINANYNKIKAKSLINLADNYIASDDFDNALDNYNKALKYDPTNAYAIGQIAMINEVTTESAITVDTTTLVDAVDEDVFPMETKIIGNVEGWSPNSIFKLDNGEVWKVDEVSYNYISKIKNPSVTIYKNDDDTYTLAIDKVRDTVIVKKIK